MSARVLLALVFAAATAMAAPVPKEPAAPKPLPAAVVKAWTDAGAEAVWVAVNKDGMLESRTGETGQVGEVPGFRVSKCRQGVVPTLPAPDAAFALDLRGAEVTEA